MSAVDILQTLLNRLTDNPSISLTYQQSQQFLAIGRRLLPEIEVYSLHHGDGLSHQYLPPSCSQFIASVVQLPLPQVQVCWDIFGDLILDKTLNIGGDGFMDDLFRVHATDSKLGMSSLFPHIPHINMMTFRVCSSLFWTPDLPSGNVQWQKTERRTDNRRSSVYPTPRCPPSVSKVTLLSE